MHFAYLIRYSLICQGLHDTADFIMDYFYHGISLEVAADKQLSPHI